MTNLREAAQMALEALDSKHDMTKAEWRVLQYHAFTALRAALAQPEQIECTPMPPVDDDGWCEWSYPIHKGYLMQCCDCGLVHEVEFCVLGNLEPQEDGSKNGEVMGAGYQVGLRMRRHSAQPEQEPVAWTRKLMGQDREYCEKPFTTDWQPLYAIQQQNEIIGLTDEEIDKVAATVGYGYIDVARAIEAKLREKNA